MSDDRASVPAIVEVASPVRSPTLRSSLAVPAAIVSAGDHAARRFLEFFAATIRNKNTRMAYYLPLRGDLGPHHRAKPGRSQHADRAVPILDVGAVHLGAERNGPVSS
jgi:hypothetical protein